MKMNNFDLSVYLTTQNWSHSIDNNVLSIFDWVSFHNISSRFSELPDNIVFYDICNLRHTTISSVPENAIFKNSIIVGSNVKRISQPICVGYNLFLNDSEINIPFGVYINNRLCSNNSKYDHLDYLYINGYIIDYGVLS